jgi:hypothetical protein
VTLELVYSVFSVLNSLVVSEIYSEPRHTLNFCSLAKAEYELGDLTFLFSNIFKKQPMAIFFQTYVVHLWSLEIKAVY